ncbi:MAG: histidine--tRNA ligase, partial [Crocinitomicaceae bacterium]|nr:histidine--tRNA ligase [Crocinitomicaceae bacterium]
NFGETEQFYSMKVASDLRKRGIACEVYPSSVKMAKQMKYANDKKIPFVVMIGSKEMESGLLTFKDMSSGEQFSGKPEDLISKII